MPADDTEAADPTPIRRCACGRVALARCWLGENFPARWLLSCERQARRPDTPEAA